MNVSDSVPFWSTLILLYTKYCKTTLQINYNWFSMGVCFYGILYLAPKALADITSNSLVCLLIITSSQFLSHLIPIFGIESPMIGRKRILIGCQSIYSIMVMLTLFINNTLFFVVGCSTGIIMIFANYIVIWTFTCEAYPTKIRGVALSVNQMFCRVTGAIMPFTVYFLYNINPQAPIVFYTIVSTICVIILCTINEDRTGKPLASEEDLTQPLLNKDVDP